jgi:mRNA interferase MazF
MTPSQVRRGEVWYVDTLQHPDDPHHPRPAIVLSENVRNNLRDHAIVVPIYSRGTLGPTHLAIRGGTGGLAHDSVIFCEEISTVAQRFFRYGPIGPLVPEYLLEAIVVGVRISLGENILLPGR